jgi:hypothetical protein
MATPYTATLETAARESVRRDVERSSETLFLVEIGDLPLDTSVKRFRFARAFAPKTALLSHERRDKEFSPSGRVRR